MKFTTELKRKKNAFQKKVKFCIHMFKRTFFKSDIAVIELKIF